MISFPVILINTTSILLTAMVIYYAWRNRTRTGATQLLVASTFMLIWAVSSMVEMSVSGFDNKVLWRNITQIGVFYAPPACFFFALSYTGSLSKQITRLTIISYTIQTVSILLVFTDSWHHLIRTGIELVQTDMYEVITVTTTDLAKVLISLNFIYMMGSLITLVVFACRTTRKMRKQVYITITGVCITALYAVVKVATNEHFLTIVPISGIFGIACIMMLLGIFKYDFLMVSPIARNRVFDIIDGTVVVSAPDGEVIDINEAGKHLFLGNRETMPEDGHKVVQEVNRIIQKEFPQWHDILKACKADKFDLSQEIDGRNLYFHCDTYVLDNVKHRTIGTISIVRDITQEKVKNDLLKIRAERDGLTGIYNRQTFVDLVHKELKKDEEYACLMVFDVDSFKDINDTHGHICGDYALKGLCNCINNNIREQDIFGRVGGEEFAVFMKGLDAGQSAQAAESLRKCVEMCTFRFEGIDIKVTISIGVAVGPGGIAFDELYRTADHMLYQAKTEGKNCIRT